MDAKPILLIAGLAAVYLFVKGKASTGGSVGVTSHAATLKPITNVHQPATTTPKQPKGAFGLQPISLTSDVVAAQTTDLGYPADEGGPPLQ